MDIITIKNDQLTIDINCIGAELFSIKNKEGREMLWQGDPTFWSNRSTNLFPLVGRLYEKRYTYRDESYDMPIHGFARDSVFSAELLSDTDVIFTLTENETTKSIFPFSFIFQISYRLDGDKLSVLYTVKNTDSETLYYGLGGHPGFNMPLDDDLSFDDYYLEFESDKGMQVAMSDTGLMEGEDFLCPTMIDGKINLHHSMFDNDAIILYDIPKKVTLKSDLGNREIEVEFPGMDYCAFWHKNRSEAPYICIEPWTSLPGRNETIEDLTTNPTLLQLGAGEERDYLITYRFCE